MPISARFLVALSGAIIGGILPAAAQPPVYGSQPSAAAPAVNTNGELLPPFIPNRRAGSVSSPRSSLPGVIPSRPVSPSHYRAQGTQEARALWVVRYSLLSARQVHAVVERAYRYHFNALMVQVRGRGDAYYYSSIEPRAKGLEDSPPGFDPLAQIIQEAHAHRIQVFAWMDMMLVWNGKQAPPFYRHVVNQHPEWIDARYDGSPMSGTDYEGQFLNPGIGDVRDYTVKVCRDLVRHYDVDGVHMDYIRYPSAGLGYNPECLRRFYAAVHGSSIGIPQWKLRAETRALPQQWMQWKQDQVTELVREIRTGIQSEKPWVSLSAAVWANLHDARDNRMQDWPTWLNEGLVDFVCPMAYSTNTSRVVNQISLALRLAHGRHIWAGIGAWQMSEAGTAAKIEAVRRLGVQGICLFSYDGLTAGGEREDYLAALCHGPLRKLATMPRMPWLPSQSLVAMRRDDGSGGNVAKRSHRS